MHLNLFKKPYFNMIWYSIFALHYNYFMCLNWKIRSRLIIWKLQDEIMLAIGKLDLNLLDFFCNSDMLMMLNQIEYVSSKIHRKLISVNLK